MKIMAAVIVALLFVSAALGQEADCGWSETANVVPRPFPAPHGPLTVRLPGGLRSWRISIEPAVAGIGVSVFKAMPREQYCASQVKTVPYQLEDGGADLLLDTDALDLTHLPASVQRLGLLIAVPESLRVNVVQGGRQLISHVVSDKPMFFREGSPGGVTLPAMDLFLNDLVWPPPVQAGLLESPRLRAITVPSRGGEIGGLAVLYRGRWVELLYRAMDYATRPGWTGKAPLLFPATGRNFPQGVTPNEEALGSGYDWKGQRYPMPIHGFARDLPWKVEMHTRNRARFSLAASPQTRKNYPFGFQAAVDYTVMGSTLTLEYSVTAAAGNTEAMPFSIGNHITFRAPLVPGADPLRMTFESPSSVEYLKAAGGVPTGEKRQRSFAAPTPLGEIPANAAISLGGYEGDPVMVLRDPAGITIRMKQTASTVPAEPVVRFNVWGDARNGYFSPEPWVGLQNSFNLDKGMVRLEPGQSWKWRIEISVETK